ncbi:MAG: hypothetical protein JXR73_17750 [Candidatus Omnitrophica bacterium]|nr:hypothetical protein [Candidatus Omnitrophota bacterium]
MSQSPARPFEQKITFALESCLNKMADNLLKKFDVDDKESLSLFRQFCSAINTRLQWIRSLANAADLAASKNATCSKSQKTNLNSPKHAKSTELSDDFLKNMPSTQNPLREKDLNNGLVYQT